VAVVLVLAAACTGGDDDDSAAPTRSESLAPAFPPAVADPAGGTTTAPAGTGQPSGAPTTADTATGATATSTAPADQVITATMTDPSGDLTPSLERPPAYADLAGATLWRRPTAFELRVKLAAPAPQRAEDAEHTMNIASFYDVNGDGHVDYEVWANLSADGWGGSYYDNRAGTASHGPSSGIAWVPQGDEVVMVFPLPYLGNASRFRWSLASEWGRYEVLTTPASARDDAPDDDQPANFG
jgi:hypothetical protein